jgi:hypothetical protein
MSTEMLDHFQEDKLRAIDDLQQRLETWQVGAAISNGKDEVAAVAAFVVGEALGMRQSLLRHWDHHWSLALSGRITDRPAHGA